MKPREILPPDDPREWLNRAGSNLARAKSRVAGAYLEDHCFDAQQAAEKAIKAVMISRGIDFPYSHDLTHLMSSLESSGQDIPPAVRRAATLTRYAVQSRYPSVEPVTEGEYIDALEIAKAVVRWAGEQI
ncbi:MAG: HEPN domain-containing protein [Rhodospirillaceae bacterium]|nr:HEPN domain-containing protein [Rhodospirillaceae bacterium]